MEGKVKEIRRRREGKCGYRRTNMRGKGKEIGMEEKGRAERRMEREGKG